MLIFSNVFVFRQNRFSTTRKPMPPTKKKRLDSHHNIQNGAVCPTKIN